MNTWLRTVNALLYIAACTLLASGLALEWKIEIEDENRTLLGLAGETWGEVHFILGLTVAALTLCHLALNWAWIRGLLGNVRGPVIAVLVAGAVIIVAVLAAPVGGSSHASAGDVRHND